jgi:hypothetical protein
MIDSSSSVVLLGGNRNGVGSISRDGCSCSWLIRARARVGASVSKMTFLSIGETPPICLQWVIGSLHPLSILISSSSGPEVVGGIESLGVAG